MLVCEGRDNAEHAEMTSGAQEDVIMQFIYHQLRRRTDTDMLVQRTRFREKAVVTYKVEDMIFEACRREVKNWRRAGDHESFYT